MSKIRYQVRGLIDMLEIRLHAIRLGIILEGLDIAQKDWMSWES